MSKSNDLSGQAAIEKIREIATGVDIAMFCTDLDSRPFHATPMSTQEVDDQGHIWFLSNRDSDRNRNIEKYGEAQLIYGKRSSSEYLSLYGKAEIQTDQAKVDELYDKIESAWFDGPNDPRITLIRFQPKEGQYWDTQNGGFVSFAKILISAYTPAELGEDGVQGSIKL